MGAIGFFRKPVDGYALISDEIVHEMDLFPTLAKFAGGKVPDPAYCVAEKRAAY